MNFPLALTLAAVSGFISLSYELILYRTVSYGLNGSALAFPLLLAAYLFGIAVGARASGDLCKEDGAGQSGPLRAIAAFVVTSNVFAFLVPPMISLLASHAVHFAVWLVLVGAVSALLGVQFPLIAHYGVAPEDKAGRQVSLLYGANIVGSTLGTLLTGVVIFDFLTLSETALGLLIAGSLAGTALYVSAAPPPGRRKASIAGVLVICVVAIFARGPLFTSFYENLLFQGEADRTFHTVIENKHGVITVDNNDHIYGGGIYDGGFNIFPGDRANHILRAYSIGLFHPAPKRVLMIGLSSGSWATVVANHPEVEKLVVVEINPGYLEILHKRDDRQQLFGNPKVEIIIDDGRRWLARHPDEKFDVVIANHSHHWRSLASNLLSQEYNDMLHEHLLEGGVYIFNTTNSERVFKTATLTWKSVQRFQSCAVASDAPLLPDTTRWQQQLENYEIWGKPVFGPEHEGMAARIAALVVPSKYTTADEAFERFYETADDVRQRVAAETPITDDNMGTEWTEFLSKD